MHLLIATGLYPPEIGGPATYAKLLEDRLPKFGINVTVFPFREVRHLPPVVRHLAYAWKVARMARSANLILVQDTVSTGLPVAIASMFSRRPFVVRVPGDYAWEQGTQRFRVKDSLEEFQKHSYGLRVGLLRRIQRFVVNRAHRIIAPSHYLGEVVRGWLSRPRDITVIYNGVDLESPSGIRDNDLIVSSGRLVPWKGFSALIDLVAKQQFWRLAILGEGPDRPALEKQIAAAKCGDRVQLFGNVSHDELRNWFSRCAVFVLNSRYEGMSHTLVEALAAGAPIVATNVGGNPEVIRDEVDGILIPARNEAALLRALVLVLHDPVMREKLSTNARERAKYFSIDRTVEETAKLFSNIKDRPL